MAYSSRTTVATMSLVSIAVAVAGLTACGHFGVDIAFDGDAPEAGTNVDGGVDDDGGARRDGASDASADASDAGPIPCTGPSCAGIYVAGEPGVGSDTNPGTSDKPVATIQKGIELAVAIGVPNSLYIAGKSGGGKYSDPFTVVEGVSLYGAYDCKELPCSWKRDLADQNLITAVAGTGYRGVVIGHDITRATTIDGLTIYGKGTLPDIFPGAVALTIEGAPTVKNCRVDASNVTGGTTGFKRSIGIAILGPATKQPEGPRLEKNVVRSQQSVEDSVAILMDVRANATINATVAATITGDNNIRSAQGVASVGILVRKSSKDTRIENNAISAGPASGSAIGSWAIIVDRGPAEVFRNRLNMESNSTGTSGAACTQNIFCGGFQSINSSATVRSNIIRGARGPLAAGVLVHAGEGVPGELVVNGNTIDPVGDASDNDSVSSAIALTIERSADAVVGRVRNNILLGGTNALRFGVYEQKLSVRTIHLQVVSNNSFWNPTRALADGDFAYRTWNGATETNFLYSELANVTTPATTANVGADPKLDSTFHLTSASTAVFDKGTMADAPGQDIDGDPRSKGTSIDLGCDEKL